MSFAGSLSRSGRPAATPMSRPNLRLVKRSFIWAATCAYQARGDRDGEHWEAGREGSFCRKQHNPNKVDKNKGIHSLEKWQEGTFANSLGLLLPNSPMPAITDQHPDEDTPASSQRCAVARRLTFTFDSLEQFQLQHGACYCCLRYFSESRIVGWCFCHLHSDPT